MNIQRCIYYISWAVFLCFLAQNAKAQEKADLEPLKQAIEAGDLAQAMAELDFFTARYPNDPDVLLLKASFLYQSYLERFDPQTVKALSPAPEALFIGVDDEEDAELDFILLPDNDESIYQPVISSGPQYTPAIPQDGVAEPVALLQKALKAAPKRQDIHYVLCHLYALSLNREAFLAHLPALNAAFEDKDSLAVQLAAFAKMFGERGDEKGEIQIFDALTQRFPNQGAIFTAYAGRMYDKGETETARRLYETAVQLNEADYAARYNLHIIYLIEGDYTRALSQLKNMGAADADQTWLALTALEQYRNNHPNWKQTLYAYLNRAQPPNKLFAEDLARFLVSDQNKNDYASYQASTLYAPLPVYRLPLIERAAAVFPDSLEPALDLANALSLHKNYRRACQLYATAAKRFPQINQDADFNLNYGYALQQLGQTDEADKHWTALLDSPNDYQQNAAVYFYSKNLIEKNKLAEAQQNLEKVANQPGFNKYTYFCNLLLSNLQADDRR